MRKRKAKLRLDRETLLTLDPTQMRLAVGGESMGSICCEEFQDPPNGDSTGAISTYPTVHNVTCPGVSASPTQCATQCPSEVPGC